MTIDQSDPPTSGQLSTNRRLPATGALALAVLANDSAASRQARAILDFMPLAVYLCDTGGTIVYFNRHAAELWGNAPAPDDPAYAYCGSERLYSENGEFVPRDNIPMARAVRFGESFRDHVVQVEGPGGHRRWCAVNVDPLYDDEGRLAGAINIFQDISERRLAAAAVRASERRYAELIESLGVAVYTTDADGRITMFNQAAADLWGRAPELGVDRWCGSWRLYDSDGAPLAHEDCPMGIALRQGKVVRGLEAILERPDGTRAHFVPYPTPFIDDSGAVTGAVNVLVDITARKQAEEALRASELRLRAVTGELAGALREAEEQRWIAQAIGNAGRELATELDLKNLLQSITDIATRMTGAQFGAFFYNDLDDAGERDTLYTLSGAPREAFAHMPMPRNTELFEYTFRGKGMVRVDDVLADPRYGHMPPHFGLPEGHVPVRSYLAAPVIQRGAVVAGGLFLGHEEIGFFGEREEALLTGLARWAAVAIENASLYKEVRDSAERLEQANATKDEFLSLVSHELRTPITVILGNSSVLTNPDRKVAPKMRAEALRDIARESERLNRIIENLLVLARIERGKGIEPDPIRPAEVVRRLIERMRPHIGRHELVLDVAAENLLVAANEFCVEQILTNLLSNATKFSPPGTRIVTTVRGNGKEALISVRDEGPGIPPEERESIFTPFYRSKHTSGVSGVGIGLTVCKRLVESQSGRIWASGGRPSGDDSRGAEFTFALPLYAE